jgi:hypothetical protein
MANYVAEVAVEVRYIPPQKFCPRRLSGGQCLGIREGEIGENDSGLASEVLEICLVCPFYRGDQE